MYLDVGEIHYVATCESISPKLLAYVCEFIFHSEISPNLLCKPVTEFDRQFIRQYFYISLSS